MVYINDAFNHESYEIIWFENLGVISSVKVEWRWSATNRKHMLLWITKKKKEKKKNAALPIICLFTYMHIGTLSLSLNHKGPFFFHTDVIIYTQGQVPGLTQS